MVLTIPVLSYVVLAFGDQPPFPGEDNTEVISTRDDTGTGSGIGAVFVEGGSVGFVTRGLVTAIAERAG